MDDYLVLNNLALCERLLFVFCAVSTYDFIIFVFCLYSLICMYFMRSIFLLPLSFVFLDQWQGELHIKEIYIYILYKAKVH
jgi:hypothetical protein